MFQDNGLDVTPEMKKALQDSVSADPQLAAQASYFVKSALTTPLQSGVVYGDTITGIFNMPAFDWGVPVEFPLDAVSPAEIKLHVAYTVANEGYIPMRTIEADYITIKLYRVATSCDWSRHMAKSMRWDIVGRAMNVAEAGMVRKRNNDGWHTIIAAASDRGISFTDSTATAGLFTKREIALLQTGMRRNAGGNSTSTNRGRLTHVAMSPESLQDVRSWDVTQVDEITRREIFIAGEGYALTKIFGTTLVDLDELGVGQEYQVYFTGTLGGTTPGSKDEIIIGLDLANGANDSFIMPWRKQDSGQFLEVLDKAELIHMNRAGFTLSGYYGCSIMNNVRLILGAV